MADERYEWLDQDTAERLLRGEPVDAPEGRARTQAGRLDRALRSAGAPRLPLRPEDGEMQGEAAATAAFRRVRAEAPARIPQEGESLGVVRLTRPPRPRQAGGLPRTVRFGVVAAVAGFAFCGVAVAAGSGLLPSPFPAPPAGSHVVGGDAPTPVDSEPPAAPETRPPVRPPAAAGTSPSAPFADSGAQSGAPKPSASGSGSPGAVGAEPYPDGGEVGAEGWTGDPDQKQNRNRNRLAGEKYHRLVADCRARRDGTLGPVGAKRLERNAKGADRVDRFCERLLDGPFRAKGRDTAGGDGVPAVPAKPDKFTKRDHGKGWTKPKPKSKPKGQEQGQGQGQGQGHDHGHGHHHGDRGGGGKNAKSAQNGGTVKDGRTVKESATANSGPGAGGPAVNRPPGPSK
ncbi:hypothetical protein GCM10010387_09500 [Streptomyces inusitatus]|uniref:Extensin n=1 Tax=Streptomyces inusitatus TaxID=68221 RepID=A0A918PR10_9ACTN|nr:hypothetical protein [Streptomyces inusitatus]GGZ18962.1 hypothetical protein GCM10010387_09500 [Streptomyces inusitatus]